jgi:hypothetical protein
LFPSGFGSPARQIRTGLEDEMIVTVHSYRKWGGNALERGVVSLRGNNSTRVVSIRPLHCFTLIFTPRRKPVP